MLPSISFGTGTRLLERLAGVVLYPGATVLLWIRTFELAGTKRLRSRNRCGRGPRWRDGGI